MKESENGFEVIPEGNEQQVSTTKGQNEAVAAIETMLDVGPDPVSTQPRGQDELPSSGEATEQFGEPEREAEPTSEANPPQEEHQAVEVEQEQESAPLYTVKVQGEERQVTLDDLQSGYMMQSDYTRKTRGLSDERAQFEQERQQVTQERQQYSQLLTQLQKNIQTLNGEEPDWAALAAKDPVGYIQQKENWNRRQQVVQAAQQEQQRVAELEQQDHQQRTASFMQSQREALLRAKPEMADKEKGQKFFQDINTYAANQYGFTPQEVGAVMDYRLLLIVEKAMLFDKAQKAGSQVQQQVSTKPNQVVKPGSAKGTQVVRSKANRLARERLERTGDVRDAAAAIESFL